MIKQIKKSNRRSKAAWAEILESLRMVMPNLENIRIQNLGGLMVPVFRVNESGDKKHDFNVSQISDGTLRVLGLLTALYQPAGPDVTIAPIAAHQKQAVKDHLFSLSELMTMEGLYS